MHTQNLLVDPVSSDREAELSHVRLTLLTAGNPTITLQLSLDWMSDTVRLLCLQCIVTTSLPEVFIQSLRVTQFVVSNQRPQGRNLMHGQR